MGSIKGQAKYSPRYKVIHAASFGPCTECLNAEEMVSPGEVKVTWEKQFLLYWFLCWPRGSLHARLFR